MASEKSLALDYEETLSTHEKLSVQKIADVENDPYADLEYCKRERKLVRKLDLTLMLMCGYCTCSTISIATTLPRLDDLEEDLGLVGNDFNVAVSILNVGYMLAQLPSNMILTRVRPSLYLPICAAVWSCVSASTAAAHNYSGLIAIRFFLGIVEAPFFPGAFYVLSCWYTRKELALRTAVLYSGLVLATAFSGLIAAGVFSGLKGVRGLEGWRWLFIIEGAGSFTAALIAMVVMPDYPESKTGSAGWLMSDAERKLAQDRIARDRVSVPEADRSVFHGLKLAAKDYRTWIFVLMLCANHTAYSFNNFFPTIVKGFNLGSRTITLLCTSPPYLLGAIVSFLVAFSSDRMGERGFHISVPMAVAVVGFVISVATLNVPARYFASFLYTSGCFSANAMVYTWAAATLNDTPEKRACAAAGINLLSRFGNIWSPYFFPESDRPRYTMAMLLMMAFSIISICCCMVMKFVLRRANVKLREESEREGKTFVPYTL